MRAEAIREIALDCGFELAGVASAFLPMTRKPFFEWVATGWRARWRYLTDHRATIRRDPRLSMESAKSIVCVGESL